MVSQTDKENLRKLKNLRQHKMSKAVVSIKKAKATLSETTEKKIHLQKELATFHNDRKVKHNELFDNLKKQGAVNIETIKSHKIKNQQLVENEKQLIQELDLIIELEAEKEEDVKEHQRSLQLLNKKLESLKVLESQFLAQNK